ncbi:hypothetical protein LAZ67_14001214 [Cordylochernes scorpioides]|uniref:Uncharacterized protein n=1 Tax=Cordylochernes scorpioides TaxID=51811 RepID=A0ABY6L5Y3_9ARAC|nr:hypothetical protein LAZ67_14001214 [Cordylochernes scorpioides]
MHRLLAFGLQALQRLIPRRKKRTYCKAPVGIQVYRHKDQVVAEDVNLASPPPQRAMAPLEQLGIEEGVEGTAGPCVAQIGGERERERLTSSLSQASPIKVSMSFLEMERWKPSTSTRSTLVMRTSSTNCSISGLNSAPTDRLPILEAAVSHKIPEPKELTCRDSLTATSALCPEKAQHRSDDQPMLMGRFICSSHLLVNWTMGRAVRRGRSKMQRAVRVMTRKNGVEQHALDVVQNLKYRTLVDGMEGDKKYIDNGCYGVYKVTLKEFQGLQTLVDRMEGDKKYIDYGVYKTLVDGMEGDKKYIDNGCYGVNKGPPDGTMEGYRWPWRTRGKFAPQKIESQWVHTTITVKKMENNLFWIRKR